MMRRLTACLMAALLAGCTHYEPLSLHGAASMRVEVEVYKGPLTSSVSGQMGQLVGVLSDTVRDVYAWRVRAVALCPEGLKREFSKGARLPSSRGSAEESGQRSGDDCAALAGPESSSRDVIEASCVLLRSSAIEALGRAVYIPVGTCNAFDAEEKARQEKPKDPQASQVSANSTAARSAALSASQKALEAQRSAAYAAKAEGKPSATAGGDAKGAGQGPGDAGACSREADPADQFRCRRDVVVLGFDNLATIVSGAARRAADETVPGAPQDEDVRSLLVEYAAMTDQYGEQLHSRISVIQKQVTEAGSEREPRTLAVSDYLRNASRTDYVQLFDWLKADDPQTRDERQPLNTAERIRMAQRLTADAYWQKINEVYTSGQGDVAMAFIKDDLGNWDLKSFSNDPSKLLAAYRDVTNAALKTAADLTLKAASAPAGQVAEKLNSAQKAAGLANQLATGETPGTPATVAGMDIGRLHGRAADRIAAQKARFDAQATSLAAEAAKQNAAATDSQGKQAALDATLTAANQTVDADTTALNTAKTALATAKTDGSDAATIAAKQTDANTKLATLTADQAAAKAALDAANANKDATLAAQVAAKSAQARLDGLPKDAVEAIRATLDDHLAVVSALQDGIAGPAPSPTPAARTAAPAP